MPCEIRFLFCDRIFSVFKIRLDALYGCELGIEVFFFKENAPLILLQLDSPVTNFPLLLVSFSNDLIFCFYQELFLFGLRLFYCVLQNTLCFPFCGRELKSGIKPADHPS